MKKIFLISLLSLTLTLVLISKQFENYPEVRLVHGKLGPNMQSWIYKNGVERYSGRVIYWAKIINKNGYIPLDKWKWEIDYKSFTPGKLLDHDETWGEYNEKRKLGGWIIKTELKTFYIKVTAKRRFIKKNIIKEFTWYRIIKNINPISGIGEETPTIYIDTNHQEVPIPTKPTDCKKEFDDGFKKGLIEGKKRGFEEGYNKVKKYFLNNILKDIFKNQGTEK